MEPKIQIKDHLTPEDGAMLQALYSRSPASVDDHLAKLEAKGSGPFMDRYYRGYGHKSIGDCGSTTIFIEGVTMLAAKAIQDWPLYRGQESSTRYMDFSEAEFYDPIGSSLSAEIQEGWRHTYLNLRDPVREHLLRRYRRREGEDEAVYEKAINARTFDIVRAFLPAGACTNLSWHTDLRQAADHTRWLCEHPDPFICRVAALIQDNLWGRYPSSFTLRDSEKPERAEYMRRVMADRYFFDPDPEPDHFDDSVSMSGVIERITGRDLQLLKDRPRGVEVPWFLAEKGLIRSEFLLDFGSFRDVQRHRAGTVRMPMLRTNHGFHPWYLQQIPDGLIDEVLSTLLHRKRCIAEFDAPDVIKQNYIPMGYQVPCRITQSLPGFIYRLELRSSKTVHPTLRSVVLEEIKLFQEDFPEIPLYVDTDPDSWTVRRGEQDIVEKS